MVTHWSNYEYQPSFILGFHGCDAAVGEDLLAGKTKHLKPSTKVFDWLGHGIYFWEGNPARAQEWAEHRHQEGKIKTPFVVGAIIDLRRCLDLFDKDGLLQVRTAYAELTKTLKLAGADLPGNVGNTPDKAGRKLDCAVLNYLHEYRKERGQDQYDSVRGPFLEGDHLYPNAGFRSENHIQLCIRNTVCIKGYFRPIKA
jgi:hypothetical protein